MDNPRPPSGTGRPAPGKRPPAKGSRPAYAGPKTSGSRVPGSRPRPAEGRDGTPRARTERGGPAGSRGQAPRSRSSERGGSSDARPGAGPGPRSSDRGDRYSKDKDFRSAGRPERHSSDSKGKDSRPPGRGRPAASSGGWPPFSRGRPGARAEPPAEPRPAPAPTAYAGSSETIQSSTSIGASRPAANRRPSAPRTGSRPPSAKAAGSPRPTGSRPARPSKPVGAGAGPPARRKAYAPRTGASSEVPPRKRASARSDEPREGTRIQKVLSEAGIASRRAAEDLIRQGRVLVNGSFADLGQRIDPTVDRVEVDGLRVQIDTTKQYFLLNKPEGVITTTNDPEDRTTVLDIIGVHERVFPVGRLDIATEGLLLLTNDGELTHRLTHPSFEVTKTYVAEVSGMIGRGVIRTLTQTGVDLGEKELFRADAVRVLGSRKGPGGNRTVVELEVHEGPKHLVRRVLEAVDRPVLRLVRTGMGPLKLGRMTSGTYRHLTQAEVDALYREVGL